MGFTGAVATIFQIRRRHRLVGVAPPKQEFGATAQDENTVPFDVDQLPAFETERATLEDQIRRLTVGPVRSGSLDDLEKLVALRDKGIITPEEFDAKKKQILDL
ncbi:MAG: SHOCT domain-containing protein [Chloroflexi bacterium]|nr:SHOCT domain-containing protein [Chloroflexota bacterium]